MWSGYHSHGILRMGHFLSFFLPEPKVSGSREAVFHRVSSLAVSFSFVKIEHLVLLPKLLPAKRIMVVLPAKCAPSGGSDPSGQPSARC
jgi:hypothetical protein